MLSIGALSRQTGTKVQTIRYYEQIGLMNEPGRTSGGQRRYEAEDLERLAFIRHGRQLGFSLDAIREFLDLSDNPEQSCSVADSIARRQLSQVRQRILRLQALEAELERMIANCAGESGRDCNVLKVLNNHSECLTDHDTIGE
ncbi:HTH-type transcriptional regulator ZntR [Falsiruegeria litorea R37]|uniref:HTH-type transcriptional regulator ZntR n=1 Tax=Falsiruegeria litorea R37 TaxID=1200284 RepID=A0A1Y5TSZ6_9RHOB|nr:helix-turn-helix domain-containing protein [Falsiruegeria litorea]SLN71344.1 HTH-type transcriptional regulator ZntR [Falsiruegeria litorea R37]